MTSEKPTDEAAKEGEFKVVDKRRFTSTGENKSAEEKTETSDISPTRESKAELKQETRSTVQSAPPLDFASFVVSLATQGFVMLGEMPNPETGLLATNLEAARQTVDILGIIEQKTKGNLSAEEQRLLSEVLASLRLAFVNKVGAK